MENASSASIEHQINGNILPSTDFPYDERLSSCEISQLWLIYLAHSSMVPILNYFVANTQDPDMKSVMSNALSLSQSQLNSISELTDSTESPFSDKLMLFHMLFKVNFSITANGFAIANSSRVDIITHFSRSVLNLQAVAKKGLDLYIKNG